MSDICFWNFQDKIIFYIFHSKLLKRFWRKWFQDWHRLSWFSSLLKSTTLSLDLRTKFPFVKLCHICIWFEKNDHTVHSEHEKTLQINWKVIMQVKIAIKCINWNETSLIIRYQSLGALKCFRSIIY